MSIMVLKAALGALATFAAADGGAQMEVRTLEERVTAREEAALEAILAELQSGALDLSRFTPDIASAVAGRAEQVGREVRRSGRVVGLTPAGERRIGRDVIRTYRVGFDSGRVMRFSLSVDADGRVSNIAVR